MSERRDNTPEEAPARARHGDADERPQKRPRRSYYYDDATGYEVYDPSEDEKDDDQKDDDTTPLDEQQT